MNQPTYPCQTLSPEIVKTLLTTTLIRPLARTVQRTLTQPFRLPAKALSRHDVGDQCDDGDPREHVKRVQNDQQQLVLVHDRVLAHTDDFLRRLASDSPEFHRVWMQHGALTVAEHVAGHKQGVVFLLDVFDSVGPCTGAVDGLPESEDTVTRRLVRAF